MDIFFLRLILIVVVVGFPYISFVIRNALHTLEFIIGVRFGQTSSVSHAAHADKGQITV